MLPAEQNMPSPHKQRVRHMQIGEIFLAPLLIVLPVCFMFVLLDMVGRSVEARQAEEAAAEAVVYVTNDGLEEFVTDFFTKYDAAEMIPIIACESRFRHYDEDGGVLKNQQGSSATGIAQILTSVHPDPQVLTRYNRRNHTDYRVDDFDVSTLTGNIWYALVLYKTRGTKDWECAKFI